MAPSPFLHPFAKPAAEDFITIVRGEGAAVFDDDGRRYVDGLASLWYCNVGHGRAEIADAVDAQMRTLENYNTFDIFTNEPAERVSAEISALSPIPDARVFLTSSGSEAVDTALKLARMTFTRLGQPEPPRAGRSPARLPRGELRRPLGAGPAAQPGGLGPAARPDRPDRPRRPVERRAALRRAGRRDRRGHRRAGHRRRRRLPGHRRVPARPAQAVRRVRRAADLRRGHHRLRSARLVVRLAVLRRHART